LSYSTLAKKARICWSIKSPSGVSGGARPAR
jgi:hypothetical protein